MTWKISILHVWLWCLFYAFWLFHLLPCLGFVVFISLFKRIWQKWITWKDHSIYTTMTIVETLLGQAWASPTVVIIMVILCKRAVGMCKVGVVLEELKSNCVAHVCSFCHVLCSTLLLLLHNLDSPSVNRLLKSIIVLLFAVVICIFFFFLL